MCAASVLEVLVSGNACFLFISSTFVAIDQPQGLPLTISGKMFFVCNKLYWFHVG